MLDPASTTLLNVENVTQVFATGSGESRKPVLDNVSMSSEDWRDRRPARPFRLRQVDAPAYHRRA